MSKIKPDDVWKVEEKYHDKPHGWIQWKGTDVCMDIHCECGFLSHVDGEFMYHVKCPECDRVYSCNGHIQFVEVDDPGDVQIGEK